MARVVVEGYSDSAGDPRGADTRACKFLRVCGLICTYFALSIGLTFYQRRLIAKFKYPLLVGLCHMSLKLTASWFIRGFLYCCSGRHKTTLLWRDVLRSTLPVGFTSGIDIAFSNWAFEYIKVPLYTMTKSTSLIFILMFAVLFKLEKKSWSMFGIIGLITIGIAMFTYQSTEFNMIGFSLVLFASFSSGLRWTLCQFVMQKSNLGLEHPLDMMYHLQPWMLLVILPFFSAFEGKYVIGGISKLTSDWGPVLHPAFLILVGGSLAILLELVEYKVVSSLSSLSLSIAAVFKEILTLILAVLFEGYVMSPTNVVGLLLCLGGILMHVGAKAIQRDTLAKAAASRDDATARFLHHDISSSDEQDDEKDSSTEVLFSVLHSRDR